MFLGGAREALGYRDVERLGSGRFDFAVQNPKLLRRTSRWRPQVKSTETDST